MIDAILSTALNKGGAGVSASAAETVAALNPIMDAHVRLLHAYEYVRQQLGPGPIADALAAHLRTARGDAGKLSETILSLGGTPISGTAIEPGSVRTEGTPAQMLTGLAERESAFRDQVAASLADVPHQIRTGATLGIVRASSEARLTTLRDAARRATS